MFETCRIIILCALFVFTVANKSTINNPIVEAPVGKIRGSILTSRLDKSIYSFRNVLYAKPPVGENRFKIAIPAEDWDDIYDATEEGPACPTLSNTTISEDCLRLNVYTTKLQSQNAKGKNIKGRPVMFFIHPGAYYSFSGQSRYFGPQYILDKDIVLVTINYRLGALGFLATGDSYAPGNLGLKDQVLALRWVQRNIAAFGGDPNCVTIVGYSAGGTSVALHMLSPMSKGLFHKAIIMSGSPTKLKPFGRDQKNLAIKQAELLGCPTDTTESMLTCLKSQPVERFTETLSKFFEYGGDPVSIWLPVVEPEVDGVERFLSGEPVDLIREGKINEAPLIIGTTTEEFGRVAFVIDKRVQAGNTTSFKNLNTRWNSIAPISFQYERDTPRSNYISQELRKFYFGNEEIGTQSYDGLAHIYSDSIEIFPVHRLTKLMADNSKHPVYVYQFSYKGRYSFAMWNDTTTYKGPVHHDDLQYLFYMSAIFPFYNGSDPEIPMIERSTAMWTNFMHTGQPIPRNNELFKNVKWERFETVKDNYLDINLNPTMKQGIFPERLAISTPAKDWNDIYDATEEGPSCPSLSNTTMSEDCLRLNVYTTKLQSHNAKDKNFKGRPVMFFIHPGAFYVFSGQSRFFGPEYILDKDIVLVTINYRLGTLGFLSSGDSNAPGNLGLKDQVLALRWVQRNIAAFGGDPNCVTIAGYSVGSVSVLLHMLSPMSKGLFHRAIAMSGSDVNLEPYPRDQKNIIKKQAELLDCPTDSIKSMISCLKSKPVENFTETMSKFFEYYGDPILIWSPVVEPEVDGVERFLPAQPADLIREGKINEAPLIIGSNQEEFGGVVYGIEKIVQGGNTSILDNLNTQWNTIAPISFQYERNTPRSNYISQELKKFYFGNEEIGTQSYDGIAHIYADSIIIFPVHRVTQLMADYSKLPVYSYQFTYKGRFSFSMWNDTTTYKGPVHHDDLQYLFYMSAIFPYFNETDPEIAMVELYTTMWTNFIQTGKPIPTNNEKFRNIKWEKYSSEKDNFLKIDLHPTMKEGLYPERMAVWARLFPLPPLPSSINYQNNQ
ncbi:hypothetical protein M0802_003095 [Mischocyttarus mexicanus]|nr:hypothetical protein M0802_003095 [Mischocyttarus mexicanus]